MNAADELPNQKGGSWQAPDCGGPLMRWQPSPEQIALAIDCAVARVPLERAAALLGIKPRTLRSFLMRIEAARATKDRCLT
jgi:hypothetical protein